MSTASEQQCCSMWAPKLRHQTWPDAVFLPWRWLTAPGLSHPGKTWHDGVIRTAPFAQHTANRGYTEPADR